MFHYDNWLCILFFFSVSRKNQSINYSLDQLIILVLVRFMSKPCERHIFVCFDLWHVCTQNHFDFWFWCRSDAVWDLKMNLFHFRLLAAALSVILRHTQSALWTAPHTPAKRSYPFAACCTPDGSGSIPSSINPRTGPVSGQFSEPKHRNCQLRKGWFYGHGVGNKLPDAAFRQPACSFSRSPS